MHIQGIWAASATIESLCLCLPSGCGHEAISFDDRTSLSSSSLPISRIESQSVYAYQAISCRQNVDNASFQSFNRRLLSYSPTCSELTLPG